MNQIHQAKSIPAHLSRDEITRLIKEKVQELRTYTPKVGVFGVTGVGKSSLCNALFGKEVSPVSDVAACTREPQEIFIGSDNQGIKLIDVPGVGETIERDAEYFELYKQLAPELDLIIWVIKADDRAFAIAEKAYKEILAPNLQNCPVVFVINQVDKLCPFNGWDHAHNQPGAEGQINIDAKVIEVSKAFDTSANKIETVSVAANYRLTEVMDKIIEVLPKEKKYSVIKEASDAVKSEGAQIAAEQGIWETVREYAAGALELVKDVVADLIVESAPKVLKAIFNKIKFW